MAIPLPRCLYTEKGASMSSPPCPSSSPAIPLSQEDLKKIAAHKAVDYVKSGMVIGLGTGSTAQHAVARIAELLNQGELTSIIGIPTSKQTLDQAVALGIPLSDLDDHPTVDVAIDGADEVDTELNLIKGRGGSLLREKMVEASAKKFIVIVDESKLVRGLGSSGHALPVEVVPFCAKNTARKLERLFDGCKAEIRVCRQRNGEPFVTDNANYIVNLFFERGIGNLEAASERILGVEGVIEHGMFLGMATTVVVAGKSGVTFLDK
ncbi:hypothetical protein AMTRI_Chr13g118960 [Amborella trichopoda]